MKAKNKVTKMTPRYPDDKIHAPTMRRDNEGFWSLHQEDVSDDETLHMFALTKCKFLTEDNREPIEHHYLDVTVDMPFVTGHLKSWVPEPVHYWAIGVAETIVEIRMRNKKNKETQAKKN